MTLSSKRFRKNEKMGLFGLVAAGLAAFSISTASAGQYGEDLPWSSPSNYDCTGDLDSFYGDESKLWNAVAKCGIRITVVDENGQGWLYETRPATIFEPIDDPAAGAEWVKTDFPADFNTEGKVDWWTQNDDFEAGRSTFYRNDAGFLAYTSRLYKWNKDIAGGVGTTFKKNTKEKVTTVPLLGRPAVVPKIRQRMIHAYVRTSANQIDEWVFNGVEWKKTNDPIATDAASDPTAHISNANDIHIERTPARFVTHYSCDGKWPNESKPFTDLTRGGCWTCDGAARTVFAVDSDSACNPGRSHRRVVDDKPATGLLKTKCSGRGWFLHRLTGRCYKCPRGYIRSTEPDIGSRKACVKHQGMTSAKRLGEPGTPDYEYGCPAGSFRNGLSDNCYECPGGGDRTIFISSDLEDLSKACEVKDRTTITVHYLSTDGKLKRVTRGFDGDISRSSLPAGPTSQPFRVPGVKGMFAVNDDGDLVHTQYNRRSKKWEWKKFHTQPNANLAGPGFGSRYELSR